MTEQKTTFSREDRKEGIYRTVGFLLIVIATLVALFVWRVMQPRILSPKELYNAGAVIFDTPREVSAFELLDKNNEPFTQDDLVGKWTFVFFGFTNCPDICPTTVALFNQMHKQLADTQWSESTQFVLVSLDPARDTPEKMKSYVDYFNPEIEGITGDFRTLKRFANQMNIAFSKVVTDHVSGDYTIDHSGAVVLMNAQGHYQGFYKTPLDLDRMALTYQSIRMEKNN